MPVTPIPYYQVEVRQVYQGQEHGGSLLFSFTSTNLGVEAVKFSYVWDEMRWRIERLQEQMDAQAPCDLTRVWYCTPPTVGNAGIDLEGGS